ncbi:MAG: efflux RND transporter periplasmic adaptor subunit [Phycisphaerales bacterium]|nr:MAG: efflux RND transporter periplasmic adaptor subunit [Phycisphaerales bacterium]
MNKRITEQKGSAAGAVVLTGLIALVALSSCTNEAPSDGATYAHENEDASAAPTNHIAIPPSVRQNLGITFVKAERRAVRSVIRLPGQFEFRPEARRAYNAMLPGRVRLAVEQFQTVSAGDLLFELDSPQWHRVQSGLAEAFKACFCCLPELDAARAAKTENETQIEFLEQRIRRLMEAGSRDVKLEAELSKLQTKVPRLEAEVRAKEADMQSALLAYAVLLNEAQSLTGVHRDQLEQLLEPQESESLVELKKGESPATPSATPYWSTVDHIVVRAETAGVIAQVGVTNQGWAETGDLIVETIDPAALRFHADALQTDISLFEDGQAGRIVPPLGGSLDLQDTMDGQINVGFQAHPEQRTIPIYVVPEGLPRWAKAGVTAYLEVFVAGEEGAVLAIPEAAVVRAGLERIFFRRDPHDPDQVIRVVADLGATDNRWIEVRSGVHEGDEVVLGGVYPLLLASSATGETQKGRHFHADGTFHEGDEH